MKIQDLIGSTVHFIGIGGVSMSGIAKYLCTHKINVQGSDSSLEDSKYIKGFDLLDIKLFNTHRASNITKDVKLVVKTSTVRDDNPEILQAKEFGIPIIERYEALEMIISNFKVKIGISGSSGKTTTTALLWQAIYSCVGSTPSCIIGTILNETESSLFVNDISEYCIVEADESDGSFSAMNFDIVVITDIENDHLDHHKYQGTRDNLIEHFKQFALKTLNRGGIVIYNSDCRTSCHLMQELMVDFVNQIYSYSGIEKAFDAPSYKQGDCFLTDVKNVEDGVYFSCDGIIKISDVFIPIIGKLNAFNALPALLVCHLFFKHINTNIFQKFKGVNKRAEIVGIKDNMIIIDDYAHSPKKIDAFIKSFSSYCKEIGAQFVIICEPHKYTRVHSLYEDYIKCFDGCNYLIMMEIFGVQGRGTMEGLSSQKLVQDIYHRWQNTKNESFFIKSLNFNKDILSDGTLNFIEESIGIKQKMFYVFLGAGFSSKYAHLLWNKIK